MKRTLILIFAFAICFGLCAVCRAEETENTELEAMAQPSDEGEAEEFDLKEYITEKILPVIIGVATSSLGFVAVLGTISRTLKGLKDIKDTFSGEAKKRQEEFKQSCQALESRARELEDLVADVPQLTGKVDALANECKLLAEILTLGFSANSEIIKSGKGKKMAMLLEKSKHFSSSNEINPSSEFVK